MSQSKNQSIFVEECPPFAKAGVLPKEWSFEERYPELAYLAKKGVSGYTEMEHYYNRIIEFTEGYIAPRALEIDLKVMKDPSYVPWDILEKACEYQLFSGFFPRITGGGGMPFISYVINLEVIATHCVGLANLIGVSGLAISCVVATMNTRLIKYIADLISENERKGKPILLSTCLTESGAGSDAEDSEEFEKANLKTFAKKVKGGYVLNSNKVFISNGSLADLHVVFAFSDRTHLAESSLILLVPNHSKGVSCARNEKKMGQRICPASEMIFEDVFVPDDMVVCLDRKASTGILLANVLGATRSGVGGFATGVAEGAYRTALAYVRKSQMLGIPMEQHQWVQLELAELCRRAQMSRAIYLNAITAVCYKGLLSLIDSLTLGKDAPEWLMKMPPVKSLSQAFFDAPAMTKFANWLGFQKMPESERNIATAYGDVAKVSCSDLAFQNCQQAISLMGKEGCRHANGAEKLLRDVKLLQIYEGTNQINMLDYVKKRLQQQFIN
ncbi:acyl-CoA dehydrogenase family protein [Deltaproteobacteria bacterium TL4]